MSDLLVSGVQLVWTVQNDLAHFGEAHWGRQRQDWERTFSRLGHRRH